MSQGASTIFNFFIGALYLIGFIVALGVIGKVLEWLSYVVASACNYLTDAVSTAIIRMLQRAMSYGLQLIQLAYGAISAPIKRIAVECWLALQERLKLWQLYWQYGRDEFRSFRSFCRYMRGEGDDREQEEHESEKEQERERKRETPSPEKPANAYKDALLLLGFGETESLDLALLKKRHRELISRVHPDKGCPTPILAQQINDAVKLVKQKRGWK
ncbi:J domain-containing protein [endosymbiont of Ridgeia piscesae]|nr:hypothetical protein [endosymbiont of Ridgeia piscesae]